MYLVVPADDSVTISVCKCEFDDDYMPYDGEELISTNEPVLIRGNMSDTIPNLYVIAKKGSEKVEYTPVQSGMDGRLIEAKMKDERLGYVGEITKIHISPVSVGTILKRTESKIPT